jgi:hypothetical protein
MVNRFLYLDFFKVLEYETHANDDLYRLASETDFGLLIDNQIYYKYSELLTILEDEMCYKPKNILFSYSSPIPHSTFNDVPYQTYLTVNHFITLGYFYQQYH